MHSMLPLRGLHLACPFLDLQEILVNFFDLLATRSDGQLIEQDFGEQLNSTLSSNLYPPYFRGSPHSLNIGGISSASSFVVSTTKKESRFSLYHINTKPFSQCILGGFHDTLPNWSMLHWTVVELGYAPLSQNT